MTKTTHGGVYNEDPHVRVDGSPRPRLVAWMQEHDSHGLMYNSLIWMPEGDKPETGCWIRASWLDEPHATKTEEGS